MELYLFLCKSKTREGKTQNIFLPLQRIAKSWMNQTSHSDPNISNVLGDFVLFGIIINVEKKVFWKCLCSDAVEAPFIRSSKKLGHFSLHFGDGKKTSPLTDR